MKLGLLDSIVCPADGQRLQLINPRAEGAEVKEGTLTCPSGHTYPIERGVPRLLTAEKAPVRKESVESFSAKWKRIPDFGHEDASRDFYVTWYLQRYGFGDLQGLRRFLADKRTVLDAGTGVGRDTVLYAQNSKAQVFG